MTDQGVFKTIAKSQPPALTLERWEVVLISKIRLLRTAQKPCTFVVRFDGRSIQVLETTPITLGTNSD